MMMTVKVCVIANIIHYFLYIVRVEQVQIAFYFYLNREEKKFFPVFLLHGSLFLSDFLLVFIFQSFAQFLTVLHRGSSNIRYRKK